MNEFLETLDLAPEIKGQIMTQYNNEKRDQALTTALEVAGVHEIKAVMPYINVDDISLDDNGDIQGLNLNVLKTEHSFLFKESDHETLDSLASSKPQIVIPGNPRPPDFGESWESKIEREMNRRSY